MDPVDGFVALIPETLLDVSGASRVLIPSTMQARRTRAYISTLYILCTFHRVGCYTMEGGGWSSIQAPLM